MPRITINIKAQGRHGTRPAPSDIAPASSPALAEYSTGSESARLGWDSACAAYYPCDLRQINLSVPQFPLWKNTSLDARED